MTRIAVVIIGRNEGERLRLCICSVLDMHHSDFKFEAVYVDSASTDGSATLAEEMGLRTIVLHEDRQTAALARNAGWRATSGDFVLFLDGDTMLNPNFVGAALPSFADPKVAAVCGLRNERAPQASLYNRVFDLDWNGPAGPTDYCGGDALFRRAALEEADGYDASLAGGEEPELCTRLRLCGWTILRLTIPMTLHDLAMTSFAQYWRRGRRTGYAYAEVSARFANTALPLWSREAAHNRRHVLITGIFLLAMLLSALILHQLFPLEIAAFVALLVLFRTAWRARTKSRNAAVLLLYAVHSHLQQLPIYLGQSSYLRRKLH